ncbi:MAG: hypothetical protein J0L75_16310 [Spirochaetes bacterium]|nr:hypothetical protein [Spirochaetota bacterium]
MRSIPARSVALAGMLLPALLGAFPNQPWRHLRDGHFTLSYERGFEATATNAMRIAEEVREAMGPVYGRGAVERPIAIAMADDSDEPNGGAYFDMPLITISPRKSESLWRGETHWLRAVISHELSHLYSFKTLVPPIRLGVSGAYQGERPSLSAGAEISIDPRALPVWLAEAFSQLGSYEFKAEIRDAYREALLRDAWHGRRLLTLSQMGRFEGTSREFELAYNQGFSLILYLKRRFQVTHWEPFLRELGRRGIDGALQKCFSIGLAQLDRDWREDLGAGFGSPLGDEAVAPVFERQTLFKSDRRDLLGMVELESLPGKRGVVANWRHDSLRLDLFLLGQRQPVPDVGPHLRWLPKTGEVFYTRKILDRSGRESDDLFSCYPFSMERRWTTNARVTAFDVDDEGILVASCVGGRTSLLHRPWTVGAWKTLAALPGEYGVYDLCLDASHTPYAVIGDGEAIRAYRLGEGGVLAKLWPEHPGDLRDLRIDGGGRCLFVSTEDGTPQAYLADSAESTAWQRVSRARAAVRYPAFESAGKEALFSQFTAGKWVRVSAPLPTAAPQTGPSTPKPYAMENPSPSGNGRPILKSGGALLPTVPFFSLAFSQSDAFGPGGAVTSERALSAGVSTSLLGSGLDTGLALWGRAIFPLPFLGPDPGWRAGAQFDFPIGVLRMRMQYGLAAGNGTSVNYGVSETYSSLSQQASWQTWVQASRYFSIYAEALGQWADYSSSIQTPGYTYRSSGTDRLSLPGIYQVFGGALGLQFQQTSHEKMGATGLAAPGIVCSMRLEAAWLKFNPSYWSKKYLIGDNQRLDLQYLVTGSLPIKSRAWSMDLEVEERSMNTSVKSTATAIVPMGYFTVGGENSFSGFPGGFLPAISLIRLHWETRWNPFFNAQNGFHWWDRLGLGAKVEGGLVTVPGYSGFLFVSSTEFALRFRFYAKASQRSSVYVKVGVPLTKGYAGMPGYQLYAGLSL